MKHLLPTTFFLICSCLLLSIFPSYSTIHTTILGTELTDSIMDGSIFQIDEIMLNDVYPEASVKPVGIPPATNGNFSHNRRFHYTANNSNLPDFLVITPNTLYDSLYNEIKTYAEDIHAIYGYGVYVETIENGNPSQLKSLILNYQNNLYGVLFIGNLSECMYEIEKDYGRDDTSYGYKKWPCDLYFMDLNGIWSDTDGNGIYDTHVGDVAPDIVFGRLSANGLSSLGDEVTLIRKQLKKSHSFWWKSSFHSAETALNYIYKDWFFYFSPTYISSVFTSGFVDDIRNASGSPFSKSDYLSRLSLSQYGFVHLAVHSSPIHHAFRDYGGNLFLPELSSAIYSNKCLCYNLFCCSACNWLAASSQGYLGGTYLFNGERALSIVGSTKTGGMLLSNLFYTYLSTENIGKAFRDWWRMELGDSNNINIISWYYGMTILGDPMINLRYQISDVCVSHLTLSSFPSDNHSNLVIFKASNQIDVTGNFIIPQGTHVVFDAPRVTFGQGFTCPLGASFETRQEGCEL